MSAIMKFSHPAVPVTSAWCRFFSYFDGFCREYGKYDIILFVQNRSSEFSPYFFLSFWLWTNVGELQEHSSKIRIQGDTLIFNIKILILNVPSSVNFQILFLLFKFSHNILTDMKLLRLTESVILGREERDPLYLKYAYAKAVY